MTDFQRLRFWGAVCLRIPGSGDTGEFEFVSQDRQYRG